MRERPTTTWRNWASNQRCVPKVVERPETEDALVAIVKRADEQGRTVKAAGAGHSFTSIACTDGTLVDLSGYQRILDVDSSRLQVTVQAGITVAALNRELARRDMALENIGDIAYQSIAGATATATHGTGLRFRNMSSAIIGMRLVTGDGSVVSCSEEHETDVLACARVGIGALGIVSEVTLQCVPSFNLHAIEEAAQIDDVLERLDELVASNDHFELFWVPGTRWALTKRNRRTHEPVHPRPRWQSFRNDALIDNIGFGAVQRIGVRRPDLIPRLAKRLPSTGRQEYVDRSDKVFASKRWVRFVEMEYAVPREAFPSAFADVRRLVARLGEPIGFPVECRFVAGDDIPLSTASGRETAYIAVHLAIGRPYDQYFQGVEAIMDHHDGRPHWGKLHFQSAATLAPRYPRWGEFQAVRKRLDPHGRFANTYTDRVLGEM